VKCTSVLDKARVGDVEVDLCPSCGGLWLDHGEIERLGRGQTVEMEKLRVALKEVVLGPVHVDYCAKCHGVFLDKGELDSAVQAVKGSTLRQMITLAAGTK